MQNKPMQYGKQPNKQSQQQAVQATAAAPQTAQQIAPGIRSLSSIEDTQAPTPAKVSTPAAQTPDAPKAVKLDESITTKEEPATTSTQMETPKEVKVDESLFEAEDESKGTLGKNDPSEFDLDAVMDEAIRTQNNDPEPYNTDKIALSVPLSDSAKLDAYSAKIADKYASQPDKLRDQLNDVSSDLNAAIDAQREFTNARKLYAAGLQKIPAEVIANHRRSVNGVGDASAAVFRKYKNQGPVKLDGATARMAFAGALGGGIRRITLWNSGITITLRSLTLDVLNQYYNEINHTDYQFAKEFGAFYYLYSDLSISEYIIAHLLPHAISGSNYVDWQNTDKLLSVISWQDFPTILWAMGAMMHPNGAAINFVCAEEGCGYVHREQADLNKLRLLNTDLISDEMVDFFKRTAGGVKDEDLVEFRKLAKLDRDINIEYTTGEVKKNLKFAMRQASISDYLNIGRDYNAQLRKACDVTNQQEVSQHMAFNYFRCFVPWIENISLSLTMGDDVTEIDVDNNGTDENIETINIVMNELQENYPTFNELVKDYILETRISHIAFYFPECPKCHKEPPLSYHGYIPYDPMRAFFTLALMKLLQGASKTNEE